MNEKQVEDELSCGICRGIMDNPCRPAVCKHMFCKSCLFNWHATNRSCPLCRKNFDFSQIIIAFQLNNRIKTEKYNCSNCKNKIRISDFNSHSLQCNSYCSPKYGASGTSKLDRNNNNKNNNSLKMSKLNCTSNAKNNSNRHTFKCPYCHSTNLTSADLIDHCNKFHPDGEKQMVCPICTAMPWGDPNQKSIDFITHLNYRHRFEYDNYVDFDKDDDEMLREAILLSLS